MTIRGPSRPLAAPGARGRCDKRRSRRSPARARHPTPRPASRDAFPAPPSAPRRRRHHRRRGYRPGCARPRRASGSPRDLQAACYPWNNAGQRLRFARARPAPRVAGAACNAKGLSPCHVLARRARAVPYDGPYLSNSPFMLNVPHSLTGFNTIALQCQVPTGGWSITPQEVAGWDLTLSNNTAGALTAFTYTVHPSRARARWRAPDGAASGLPPLPPHAAERGRRVPERLRASGARYAH